MPTHKTHQSSSSNQSTSSPPSAAAAAVVVVVGREIPNTHQTSRTLAQPPPSHRHKRTPKLNAASCGGVYVVQETQDVGRRHCDSLTGTSGFELNEVIVKEKVQIVFNACMLWLLIFSYLFAYRLSG